MPLNSLTIKLVVLLASMVLLSNCTKDVDNNPQYTRKATTPFNLPAAAYLAMAKNHPVTERQSMLLMAAGRSLYDGQSREAEDILSQTSNLTAAQLDEKNILLAKINLLAGQAHNAINKLSMVNQQDHLSPFYKAQYHEVLAGSYEAAGKSAEAVTERIKLERLLPDETSRADNRRILWLTLTRLPVAELNTMYIEAGDESELQGWMKLALIPREHSGNDQQLIGQVEQWQQQYPRHPANSLLPSSLAAVKPDLRGVPHKMALLLPLSGPLAGPGGAVKDGFMAAYNSSVLPHSVSVNLYDTAAGDAATLYLQALSDGAEYVVGPLTKGDVAKVAMLDHPVPTILLNDMDAGNNQNVYRFGLSPANEARQVAVKAQKRGLNRALIISPSGVWGDEIANAFSLQWQNMGAEVVDRFSYDNQGDLSHSLRDFLHVSERVAQQKQFKPVAGKNKPVSAKRRQDFDMIFLLAYPSKARQIMPLLRYYFAGDVPVYATSTVYSGSVNKMSDKDLDGIIFSDMPWIFNHQLANKNWPEQLNSYSRLYALGMDSYSLSSQLNQLLLFPAMGVNDKSGVLYLNRGKDVSRVLSFGKFRGGVAEKINETS